jgi:hypothetical protein
MQRRIPGDPMQVAATEWNQIAAKVDQIGSQRREPTLKLPYEVADGKNVSGETIAPGSPVFFSQWTANLSYTTFVPFVPGWYQLRHAYWPANASEFTDYETAKCSIARIGIALEGIANNAIGRFAIKGRCAVRAVANDWPYVRPQLKAAPSSAFKTSMAPAPWGYRVMSRFADWAVIDLDAMVMTNFYGTTSSAIAVNGWGTVTVEGETWPATTVKSALASGVDVLLTPREDHFMAWRVC